MPKHTSPKRQRSESIPPLPARDDAEWRGLPGSIRRDVLTWHKRISGLWNARPVCLAMRQLSKRAHVPYKTILKKFYALRRAGSWAALIDHRKVSSGFQTLRVQVPRNGFALSIVAAGPHHVLIHVQTKGIARRG